MTFYQLLSYNDVLLRTENGSRYLLLGNGFSIAYDRDRFSFKNLFYYAVNKNLISVNSPIHDIFKNFETYDFERVIKKLEDALYIYNCYQLYFYTYPDYANKLCIDGNRLRNILIDVLSELHPEHAASLDQHNYSYAKNFIKEYNSIFTLNYDLLLTWATLELQYNRNYINNSRLEVNDGFGRPNGNLIFKENNLEQTIYFLHGALHIFDDGIEITKISSKDRDKSLIPQIRENILYFSKYPLFVSEGTWQNKLLKIKKNIYLNHCYNSLKKLGFYNNNDSLVIFGTLLKSNDNHIIEAIKQNNIKNIYIGLSSENKMYTDCSHIIKELEETKNIYFYDYTTVFVWNFNFKNFK
ncbi:DUF4917 family protein [Arcobacter sp. L]|uniref:DUF4917 family protein n=1 Tax=Arcobacter sp. L TaxID=944547 RepID=UPI00022964EA|nr:DUF4917 family protein [Arcobacter sp. L]BAK73199.1 conserved hypothetical protein [Arcobacter sp. L]